MCINSKSSLQLVTCRKGDPFCVLLLAIFHAQSIRSHLKYKIRHKLVSKRIIRKIPWLKIESSNSMKTYHSNCMYGRFLAPPSQCNCWSARVAWTLENQNDDHVTFVFLSGMNLWYFQFAFRVYRDDLIVLVTRYWRWEIIKKWFSRFHLAISFWAIGKNLGTRVLSDWMFCINMFSNLIRMKQLRILVTYLRTVYHSFEPCCYVAVLKKKLYPFLELMHRKIKN